MPQRLPTRTRAATATASALPMPCACVRAIGPRAWHGMQQPKACASWRRAHRPSYQHRPYQLASEDRHACMWAHPRQLCAATAWLPAGNGGHPLCCMPDARPAAQEGSTAGAARCTRMHAPTECTGAPKAAAPREADWVQSMSDAGERAGSSLWIGLCALCAATRRGHDNAMPSAMGIVTRCVRRCWAGRRQAPSHTRRPHALCQPAVCGTMG